LKDKKRKSAGPRRFDFRALRNDPHAQTAAAIFLLAFAVRLLYLYQASRNPGFMIPLVDSQAYDAAARQLAVHGTMSVQFFWQAFFYPLFLACVYAATGCSIIAAKLFQAVLGAAVCVLVYRLAFSIFDRRTALLAAAAAAFNGSLIFFGGELLATTWAAFWTMILILLFMKALKKNRQWLFLSLGICGGLSVVTRATFVPFFAMSCIWLAFYMRRLSAGRKPIILAGTNILAGFMLIVVPVSILSYRVTDRFSPFPESGPINLYIGNNYEHADIMAARPGGAWDELTLMPVRSGFRTRNQVQKFFLGRVASYVKEHPLNFFKRTGRKTVHFFTSREIPNNTDIYANRQYSALYSIMMWKTHNFGFPFGVLLPFFIIGMVSYWRRIPAVIRLFLILYPLSIILVFVTSRYRAPMIPVMAIIAAAGFWKLIDTAAAGRWMRLSLLLAAMIFIGAASSIAGPFAAELVNYEAEKHHYTAIYYLDRGKADRAIKHLQEAIKLDPGYSEAYQSLGMALVRKNKFEEASLYFEKALKLNPDYYSAHNNLGALLIRAGKYSTALVHLEKALKLNPHSDSIHANIGIALIQMDRPEEAVQYLNKALFYAEAFGNHSLAAKIKKNFGPYLRPAH